jgi:hypothetical protein
MLDWIIKWKLYITLSKQIQYPIESSAKDKHGCKPPVSTLWLAFLSFDELRSVRSGAHLSITRSRKHFMTKAYIYITNLVCYTYFHWLFNPQCQHIFGKETGYIFQSPKTIKTWTTKYYARKFSRLKVLFICYGTVVEHRSLLNRSGICDGINRYNIFCSCSRFEYKNSI